MFKKLFIVSFACLPLVISPCGEMINPDTAIMAEAKTYVYYVPGSSYAYHSDKDCRSLKHSKKIKKTTLKKAKNKLGLKPCGICYR